MSVLRRILVGLVYLLALAVLLLSVVAGVSVWIVKEPVRSRAHWVFGRIDAALDVAEQGLDHAETSLTRATERLETVKQEQRKLAQEPRRNSTVGRLLARTIQQQVAPELSDAHETLHAVAEAAVVVNSVLEDFGNFPLLSVTGLNIDGLEQMNSRLADVGPRAWDTRLGAELFRAEGQSNNGPGRLVIPVGPDQSRLPAVVGSRRLL
jgi:hypothetical protein